MRRQKNEYLAELLYGLLRNVKPVWKQVLREQDLSPASLQILRQVAAEPGITINLLAQRTGIAKSHVSRLVNALCGQGRVEKHPDPSDQRLTRLYLTASGKEYSGMLEALVRSRLAGLAAMLPEEKADALCEGLRALQDVLNRTP
ncbi:MAG: MarR family winged helix-turn-helix transcriptional regulator [Desulfotomaculales bacterium]